MKKLNSIVIISGLLCLLSNLTFARQVILTFSNQSTIESITFTENPDNHTGNWYCPWGTSVQNPSSCIIPPGGAVQIRFADRNHGGLPYLNETIDGIAQLASGSPQSLTQAKNITHIRAACTLNDHILDGFCATGAAGGGSVYQLQSDVMAAPAGPDYWESGDRWSNSSTVSYSSDYCPSLDVVSNMLTHIPRGQCPVNNPSTYGIIDSESRIWNVQCGSIDPMSPPPNGNPLTNFRGVSITVVPKGNDHSTLIKCMYSSNPATPGGDFSVNLMEKNSTVILPKAGANYWTVYPGADSLSGAGLCGWGGNVTNTNFCQWAYATESY